MITDNREDIQMCLECTKVSCTNCLERKRKSGVTGRPARAVIGTNGVEVVKFPSMMDAAKVLMVSKKSIWSSMKRKHKCCGYYWRYLDG